ncbi:universal stress protein [Halalkalicoccus tibetensis]|uniref:Universal stress protein n=1 Tax=Halalkalicoccus tibetensis TaxID=175632 RepID=A0ABD5V057_9EURY
MYDIIVGVDTDAERAVAQAEAIAELPGGDEIRAILIHVFDDEDGDVESLGAINEARRILEEAGVEVETEGIVGDPAIAILDSAERHDADCICVAGRERSPAGKAIFGSVTQDVVIGAERPTLVCSAEGE